MGARLWVLEGGKPGDTTQLLNLAERLSVPFERRRLVPKARWIFGKPPLLPSLYPFDLSASDPLAPPWPEVILVAGRRPTMAALWVQRQSQGRTQLVILGRPKGYRSRFSLILAPPQALVPEAPDVLTLEAPLFIPKAPALAPEARALEDELRALPRPLTAVMLGGATRPYRFDEAVLTDLLKALTQQPERSRGTLFFCGSRRTAPAVLDALTQRLPPGARLYRWQEQDPANPYGALRRQADQLIATSDSLSMLMELSGDGAPLGIYPLPKTVDWRERLERLVGAFPRLAALRASAVARGWLPAPRNLDAVAQALVASGAAYRLGEGQAPSIQVEGISGERALAKACAAVEALLAKAHRSNLGDP
jgi:mitochondrial fission protein ELM1